MQRLRAGKLFLKDLDILYSELAISTRFSDELEDLAASILQSKDKNEKYRRVIGDLRHRLVRTIRDCEDKLSESRGADIIMRESTAHQPATDRQRRRLGQHRTHPHLCTAHETPPHDL